MTRRNPFPTHGLGPSADDRSHLLIVDLSQPTVMMICHQIDRLRNTDSIRQVRDYAADSLDRQKARKRGVANREGPDPTQVQFSLDASGQ